MQTILKNLPNQLTLLRILMGVFVPIMIFAGGDNWRLAAVLIYALAIASDWLDGSIARWLNAVSEFGRMLDPIADKMLLIGCLFAMAAYDGWGWTLTVPALLIILREALVSGLREIAAHNDLTLHVTWTAKFKTATQLTATGIAMAAPLIKQNWYIAQIAPIEEITIAFFWLAAGLTTLSGWGYLKKVLDSGSSSD